MTWRPTPKWQVSSRYCYVLSAHGSRALRHRRKCTTPQPCHLWKHARLWLISLRHISIVLPPTVYCFKTVVAHAPTVIGRRSSWQLHQLGKSRIVQVYVQLHHFYCTPQTVVYVSLQIIEIYILLHILLSKLTKHLESTPPLLLTLPRAPFFHRNICLCWIYNHLRTCLSRR